MKRLPITLWSVSRTEDRDYQRRVLRVLRYCSRLFKFDCVLLFSFLPVPDEFQFPLEVVQIPPMDINQFNIFVNRVAPRFLTYSACAMSVHEDGFILNPDLWYDQFLEFDYIGSPWSDGVVGNGAFNIESRKLLMAKMQLPFYERLQEPFDARPFLPSDVYLCRTHRKRLEAQGITFADTFWADIFSAEQRQPTRRTLGFHGRKCRPEIYAEGWSKIEESEK